MSDLRTLSREIREQNPIKFLELLPDLMTGVFLEKILPLAGIPNHEINNIIDGSKKNIDNKLKSKYNLYRVGLGGIIFLVGNYLTTELSSKNQRLINKEEKNG